MHLFPAELTCGERIRPLECGNSIHAITYRTSAAIDLPEDILADMQIEPWLIYALLGAVMAALAGNFCQNRHGRNRFHVRDGDSSGGGDGLRVAGDDATGKVAAWQVAGNAERDLHDADGDRGSFIVAV